MNSINELLAANQVLADKCKILSKEAEHIQIECEQELKSLVHQFIQDVLAPAANIPANRIFLTVQSDYIYFGIDEISHWGGNSIRAYRNWQTKEREIELATSFNTIKVKNTEAAEYNSVLLNLMAFIGKELVSNSTLAASLTVLCDQHENIFDRYYKKVSEINSLKCIVNKNNKEIMELKIEKYLAINQVYELKYEAPLWLNNKDRTYLRKYKISKITDKKIFLTVMFNNYESNYQTTIGNYKYYIEEMINKDEKQKSKEVIEQ